MQKHSVTGSALLVAHASVLALVLAGCSSGSTDSSDSQFAFVKAEDQFDTVYAVTTIDARGLVVDLSGNALPLVQVTLVGWGDASANDGLRTTTDANGRFLFSGLERRSVLLRLELANHYDEIVAADLQRPLAETSYDTGTTAMSVKRNGVVRFTFGGDTMFGRRFLDRDEDGLLGEPEDLIWPGTRARDSEDIARFVQLLLSAADYTQVNLETPVAEEAVSEHPYKSFTFFTHPETLSALPFAGIDAVSLGNNHVYDLLEPGMVDTLANVGASGVDWFGAGMTETDAAGNILYRTLGGVDVAMQGFNGIRPQTFPASGPDPWPDELLYNAMDTPVVKGGSLELSSANVLDFLVAASPTHLSIPVMHGGAEYGEFPSTSMRARFKEALENGAGFVVAHHPHTVHGIATIDGQPDAGFVLMSLGNLIFDQNVFETFQSFVAVVDVEQLAPAVHRILRVRLVPFHIEGYVPKLIAGERLERIGRHVGHVSTHLPPAATEGGAPDGLVGAVVFPARNRLVVCFDPSQYGTADSDADVNVAVSGGRSSPVPFVRTDGADMLARVRTDVAARCEYGRELMMYGDFEDLDVDDQYHEGRFWSQSEYRFVENSVVRSGSGAMVLLRRDSNTGRVSTWLTNRITFSENAEVSVHGWVKGSNAGRAEIDIRWYVRDEATVISTTVELEHVGGTFGWEPFVIDLTPPAEAGTVRVYFRQYPPSEGEGSLFLDDVSIIQWEESVDDAQAGFDLETPNNWSWLRFSPADGSLPGIVATLTHRVYSPNP